MSVFVNVFSSILFLKNINANGLLWLSNDSHVVVVVVGSTKILRELRSTKRSSPGTVTAQVADVVMATGRHIDHVQASRAGFRCTSC